MKSLIWLTLLLSAASLMFATSGTIAVSANQTGVALLSNTQTGLTVNYAVGTLGYLDVVTPRGNFTEINIEGYANTNRTGLPKLPLLRKIIRVPLEATVLPRITTQTRSTISLAGMGITNRILPRQESVAKNQDPSEVPFVIDNNFYNGTEWSDEPVVKIEEIGMLRGARLVALDFTPVQYNPATSELEIITSAEVEVSFTGADWIATDELYRRYYSTAFEPMLAQTLFNYETQRISLDRYPLGYLIITPTNYVTTLQPFINWKQQQGYNVTIATTDITGTTTSSIKTYLQNIWDSATTNFPAPSYLLIVGDTPQIPAWSSSSGHVTDLSYVRLQGTDYVPEMYFGRFSATNTTQLQAYVNKSLQYEMYTMPDPSYLSHTVLIAGVDATYGPSHGNGQINYGKTNYFGESTSPNWTPYGPYNIRNHMYLYPASGSSDAQIISDMSSGLGFINYTAHGSETSWSDPTVTISNINSMTNANKYFVAVGNCCLTNAFNTSECFGEAFTRAANKGAVAYIGGTNSTYWDEDYYWAVGYKPPVVGTGSPYQANRIGAYDAVFHYHSEAFADWASTIGSMNFMGNMAVVASNSSRISYYWEIYSIMGDPSLIPYMGIPTVNAVQYVPTVQIGLGTMQIAAEPYSYVAISRDNVLHGVGLTDGSGALTLNFTPFTTPGIAKLVVTRSLRRPLMADIQITSSAGPYLLVNSMTVNDGNNSIAESGETLYLDVVVNNVGTTVAQNVTATITTSNPHINILNGTTTLSTVQVNTPQTISNTFRIAVLTSIPDQEVVTFTILMHDNSGNSWTNEQSLTVNAPNIIMGSPTFFDPNNDGTFAPGETITISIGLNNIGHMSAGAGQLAIVINSSFATASQESFTLPGLPIGINIPLSFQVTLAANAPVGTLIPIGLALTAGAQYVNNMISLPVGLVAEGFETGNFTAFAWVNNSSLPWTIVTGGEFVHSGTYAAKTGGIGHNGLTELSITLNIVVAGNITFWRKVSSENGYDKLKFYIDANEMGFWSGSQGWAQQTYSVSLGEHTFKWTYSKDSSTIGGSDCAWIDDIAFPIFGNSSVPVFYLPVSNLAFNSVNLNTYTAQDITIRNLGTAALTGTITVPTLVDMLFNGVAVNDSYNYSIPAGGNGKLTLSLYLTSPTTFNGTINITSNDAANPSQQVSLHVQTVANEDDNNIPVATKLEGNYPNPFNPVTTIRYAVKQPGQVRIDVYNTKGQLIRTLVNENSKAGVYSVIWNGVDDKGNPVSSGVYFYRMRAEGLSQTKKMMLIK